MSKIKHLFSHFCCEIALSYFHTAFLPLFLNSQCSFQHEKMILNHRNHLHNYKFVQRTVKIFKNKKTRTEVLEKRYVIAYFCFHFWIQRGQIIKNLPIFIQRQKKTFKNMFFNISVFNCSAEFRGRLVFMLFNLSSNAEAIQCRKAHKNYHKL